MSKFTLPKLPHFTWVPPFRKQSSQRFQGPVTALDLDGVVLRMVQAAPRGNGVAYTRFAAQRLELAAEADRSDPNALGAALARALVQADLKPGPVVMGVPRAQVVLRTLCLPVLDDLRQLASMVHFQIAKDLPFRLDDAVIDFKVHRQVTPPVTTRTDGSNKSDAPAESVAPAKLEVLVAAVRRDVVEFYQQMAEAAGIKLVKLGLLPYANARCLEACRAADDHQPIALISLRPDEVNIDVMAEQALLFSRGAPVKASEEPSGGPNLDSTGAVPNLSLTEPNTPGDAFADAATIEVVRSLHGYSGMDRQNPVSKIVVTGATGLEKAVVERLSRRVTAPCTVLDIAAALELTGDAIPHAPGALSTIGLALGVFDEAGLPFDFLNPKRPAVQRDLRRIRILAGIGAGIVGLLAVLTFRQYLINRRLQILHTVEAELAEAKTKQPTYLKMIRQATTVTDWIQGGRNWLEHYAHLSALLPPAEEIYITSFSVNGSGGMHVSLQARSGEILAKLDQQLRAAGYSSKPLPITPGADRFGYEFRSSVELIAPDKMKVDLTKQKTPGRPADDASLDPTVMKKGGA